MAHKNNEENLRPFTELTAEEHRELSRKGGIASGEARREKANLKKALEMMLEEKEKKTGKTFKELTTLGLIKGAVYGKAENYKLIAQMLGELDQKDDVSTPEVVINVVDHSELEGALYEDNN